jgi:hypothetical protein
MTPGLAAVLGAVGGAAAGFVGASALTYLAIGDVDDNDEVKRFRRTHPDMSVAEARASMRATRSEVPVMAAVLGGVIGGALSASVAKNPDQPGA